MNRLRKIITVMSIVFFSTLLVIPSQANEWKRDDLGWWFVPTEGGYFKSSWNNISEKWYYFDDRGYMAENRWIGEYYVGADGAMLTDAITPDGVRVGSDGRREESFTSTTVTDYQKKAMEAIIGAYAGNFRGADTIERKLDSTGNRGTFILKEGSEISRDTILDITGDFVQLYANNLLQTNSAEVVYYRLYPANTHLAYRISDIKNLVESISGRTMPHNFEAYIFEAGYGVSDEFFAPKIKSESRYVIVEIIDIRLENGKLHVTAFDQYGKRITGVFRRNFASIVGASLDGMTIWGD